MEANIFPMDQRYCLDGLLLTDAPTSDRIMAHTCSVKICRKGIGYSMPCRSGCVWSQMKKLCHFHHTVFSSWKTVEDKP